MIDHRGGSGGMAQSRQYVLQQGYILLVRLLGVYFRVVDTLEFLESPGRISVPLWHLDAPSSDILALACKEAIPAPWTGAPWPTARRLGGPPGRATPPSVPPSHSPVSPFRTMPHGRGDGR